MFEPLTLVETLEEMFHSVGLTLTGLHQFAEHERLLKWFLASQENFNLRQGVSHNVNVLDSLEDEFCVRVESLGLVAFPPGSVGHGVDLRPGVDDVEEVGAGVDLHDAADVLLVLWRPTIEPRQRL